MKHILMMVMGCALALLLIFLLPAMGLGSGSMLTMATVSHDKAVVLFNSLLHGLDVGPILKTGVPVSQVALGLVTILILCWFAGVLIAGIYIPGVRLGKP